MHGYRAEQACEPGKIKVTLSAQGLEPTTVEVECEAGALRLRGEVEHFRSGCLRREIVGSHPLRKRRAKDGAPERF